MVKDFLGYLIDRGLNIDEGLLCIIDGAKGLRSGIGKVFGDRAMFQRCQWHKRENVVDYLPKAQKATWRETDLEETSQVSSQRSSFLTSPCAAERVVQRGLP